MRNLHPRPWPGFGLAAQRMNSAATIKKGHLRRLVFGDKNSIVALQ
jgi:hypothetical protein